MIEKFLIIFFTLIFAAGILGIIGIGTAIYINFKTAEHSPYCDEACIEAKI